MTISPNKKRIQVSLDKENLEIIKKVSEKERRTISNTINILIERYLKESK